MKIAIVGSGVSGLVVAHLLHAKHDITVFESDDRVGGHVNTVEVPSDDDLLRIDTGFIVYNEHNYPLFTKLITTLGIATQSSEMSFSVRCDRTGFEYNGSTVRQLFVQKRNLLRPSHYRMIADILRFNREAPRAIREGAAGVTLGAYLNRAGYSSRLSEYYLVPMGSALWSVPRGQVLEMPAEFFLSFFENHGMLTVDDRPEWRVIADGSSSYVDALVRPFRHRVRTSSPVRSVRRERDAVLVDGEPFDHIVFACHSDQALEMLEDSTRAERETLGRMAYQANRVVLHTDTAVLPRRSSAWGAWNYHIHGDEHEPVTVTYDMNVLQTLAARDTFCVTLNPPEWLDERKILYETSYSHPMYTMEGFAAQRRWSEVSGSGRTHYCGAYWGFGFHEDGVRSAVRVAEAFGASL